MRRDWGKYTDIRTSPSLMTMDLILFGDARENVVQVATDPTRGVKVEVFRLVKGSFLVVPGE